ncbi:MAG: polysaccharide deacetylase family protein [Spirochaetales bacterium]|nr:polysaccharide deacetylase family protein [Spirochaetales bacterium]
MKKIITRFRLIACCVFYLCACSLGNNTDKTGGNLPVTVVPGEYPDTEAIVSFSYDDGSDSWYNTGYPLFNEYGYKATFNVNAAWTLYRSDWVLEMHNNGFEFASHSYYHETGVTDENVENMKLLLDGMGISPTGFVGPGAAATPAWGHDEVNIVKQYHRYYSQGYSHTNVPEGLSLPFDKYLLGRWGLSNSITAARITRALEDSAANNTWIIFSGHTIGGIWIEDDPVNGGGSDQSPALIEFVFSEIERLGIAVKTVEEVVDMYHPRGAVIDCSSNEHQEPDLTYFEEGDPQSMDPAVWNEYWHTTTWSGPRFVGNPAVYCHTSNDSLPLMRFTLSIPNGTYRVRAELIPYDTGRTYRVFYSFDSSNPSQLSVDISEKTDADLGTVTVTDGELNLYTQNADVVSGAEGFVGWAYVKLFHF